METSINIIGDTYSVPVSGKGGRTCTFLLQFPLADLDLWTQLPDTIFTIEDIRLLTSTQLIERSKVKGCKLHGLEVDYEDRSKWALAYHYDLGAAQSLASHGGSKHLIRRMLGPYMNITAIMTVLSPTREKFADIGFLKQWSIIRKAMPSRCHLETSKDMKHIPFFKRVSGTEEQRDKWIPLSINESVVKGINQTRAAQISQLHLMDHIIPNGSFVIDADVESYEQRLQRHIIL